MKKATYVLTRCKTKTGNDRQKMTHYGTEHKTLCGKVVDEMWWIEESGMSVTCPKCKAMMVTRPEESERMDLLGLLRRSDDDKQSQVEAH